MFDSWARSKGLSSRGNVVIARLRSEYVRGFEDALADERKQQSDKLNAQALARHRRQEADQKRLRDSQERERTQESAKAIAKQKHDRAIVKGAGSYKGFSLFKTGDGNWHYSGERESAFDSLTDVRHFVDSIRKNPTKRNKDVIDDAAETGMQISGSIFAVPSAVLEQTIKTALSAKDAAKRTLRLNPSREEEEDIRRELIETAKGTRDIGELARLHKWAKAQRDTTLQNAVEKRCKDLGIPLAKLSNQLPWAWNPSVTDRALRYRANQTPPEGPKLCAFCGDKTNVEVGHLDGHEENNDQDNLIWTCRSCNVIAANTLRNARMGRLTHQYNPSGGATNIGEWMQAVGAITPHKGRRYSGKNYGLTSEMKVSDAVAMIRATSQAKRSEFASQLRRHNPKRNPESGAAHFYEKFHGKPSTEEVVIEEEEHYHENLGTIGTLCAMVVDTPTGKRATITFDDDIPFLCASEDGTQLYIEGGNQEIDLKALGMDSKEWVKDRMVIGQFAEPEAGRRWNISYITAKRFDQFQEIEYQHDLGEANEGEPKSKRRESPILEYDTRNCHLFISGGQYRIKLPLVGVSPGIEN